MTQKYTLVSGTVAGDRLLNVGLSAAQLSDGSMVMLVYNPAAAAPNTVSLQLVPATAHTTPQTIATLSTDVIAAVANFVIAGYKQSLAIAVDASDNIYIVGANNTGEADQIGGQAFVKVSGSLRWNPATYVTDGSAARLVTEGTQPAAFAMTWCNTGGGTNSKGHLLAILDDTSSNAYAYVIDAGALLAGNSSFGTNAYQNPTFLTKASHTAPAGTGMDLSNDGFGATTGLAVYAASTTRATTGGWGITSQGALTTGGGLVDTQTTGTMSATTKVRIVRFATGQWAVFHRSSVNATQLTCRFYSATALQTSIDLGTASNFPANGATLSWDATTGAVADLRVWAYGWSSVTATTMLRMPITITKLGAASIGTAITDDTTVGTAGTTIRTVKEPVDILHADWQSYQSTSAYGLLGDFSAVSGNPYPPTLLSPANNAVAPISTGGTFTWSFTSPVSGDVETAYYFRRQLSGGAYEWWTGSAWTNTETAIGGSALSITFPTGVWAVAQTYTWWMQTTGAAPTNNLSGYSSGYTVVVANLAPATPTLVTTYDPYLNRTTLTMTSTDSTATTGSLEFSDDSGVTWAFVRGASSLTVYPSAATVYDLEAPSGATRQYRAQVWTGYPTSYSAYTTGTTKPVISTFWLRDPVNNNGGVKLKVHKGSLTTTYPEPHTEHQTLGRASVIVVADVIGLEDGAANVWTQSTVDESALLTLLLGQTTLLLQAPDGRQWWIRITSPRPTAVPTLYRTGTYRTHAISWRGQQRP